MTNQKVKGQGILEEDLHPKYNRRLHNYARREELARDSTDRSIYIDIIHRVRVAIIYSERLLSIEQKVTWHPVNQPLFIIS